MANGYGWQSAQNNTLIFKTMAREVEQLFPPGHANISKMVPETDLDHLIIGEMCLQAAKGIELQCKREYWGDDTVRRATELHKLTPEERKILPTNNIYAERYFAKFVYLASQSAHHHAQHA